MIDVHRIPELLVDVADTLVDEFDLRELPHRLAEHAATVSGARGDGLWSTRTWRPRQAAGRSSPRPPWTPLAQQMGSTPDAAFDVPRNRARAEQARLTDLARALEDEVGRRARRGVAPVQGRRPAREVRTGCAPSLRRAVP